MKQPAAKRLKVFQAQIGFYDTVVAASSQAAALRAWGVRQNLFASGDARITQEAAAVTAALEHPDTPLRRAVGTNAPFELEPASLPKIPDAPKQSSKAKTPTAPARPAADRTKLDAAEAAVRALDENRKQEEADFKREEDAFESRRIAAQDTYVRERKSAAARVEAAARTYRKEGGTN